MGARITCDIGPQAVAGTMVAILFVCGWWIEAEYLPDAAWQQPAGQLVDGDYLVRRVIDGDTIQLEYADLRVRLQGIDTPETVRANTPVEMWGPEASEYTQQFLREADWQVRLTIEGEPVDRYGRHLAFVWSAERLLNEELLQKGLARAKLTFHFSRAMKDRLLLAQDEARVAGRGIWSR